MIYRLHYDPGMEAVHDAMPPGASEELSLALAAACENPLAATEPYGIDEPYNRLLVTRHAAVMLFIAHTTKTVNVTHIDYLG